MYSHQKDFKAAAYYLQKLTPSYTKQGWELIEISLLRMYATCLEEMAQSDEYANVILQLFKKQALREKSRIRNRISSSFIPTATLDEVVDMEMEMEMGNAIPSLKELSVRMG